MRTMPRVSFVTVCLLSMVGWQPASALSFNTYDTGNNSELITSVPGDDTKSVMYSINVDSIGAQDVLVVTGEGEFTNDTGDPFRISAQLILASSPTDTTGIELAENNGFYITPDMHHGVRVKAAIRKFASSQQNTYVNFVVWGSGFGSLSADRDYGRLQVMKITP